MSCALVEPQSAYATNGIVSQPLPRDLRGFRGYHAGATMLVCGCGSSLSQLTEPERFLTIGVNDVGRLFHPDYLVVLNPKSQFQGDRFRFVEESRARVIFTQLDLGISHPHIVQFRLGNFGGVDFSDPDRLPFTRNSPYVALCLAVHMGARRIGVIGVDFTNDHFFAPTGQHPLTHELPQIDEQYRCLYATCRAHGVEVFNLSAGSRLTAVPKLSLSAFGAQEKPAESLNIVSYATMPVAGVPAILSRCIGATTTHRARTVWRTNDYGNGVSFAGDVEWHRAPAEACELLHSADLVIVHNGKIDCAHRSLLAGKPVITMAHNYMWNVDTSFVEQGYPGVVVGQYQATLPEFKTWQAVPNPVPLWEEAFQPGPKNSQLTICYTPSGKHEAYPAGHRLYWHSKGYETTMRVLERLSQRLNIRLEAVRTGQISHAESLAMKKRAHIVVDECVTGSYHRNSLEGLACGCVVVNGLGRVPAISEAFCHCAGGDRDMPFVCAGLEDLESVLTRLISSGPEALLEQGRHNRRWMEAHWDFKQQWQQFWQPAVAAALGEARQSGPLLAVPANVPRHETYRRRAAMLRELLPGVSVVVCHGGEERLPHLDASLANLRQCPGINEIIVSDMGSSPSAEALARRWGDKYIFLRHHGAFERARCLNAGTALAEHDLVLWTDNDLIVPSGFISNAVSEMRARRLDYLIPYTAVNYLSEADSQQVMAGALNPAECRPIQSYRALYVCGGAGLLRHSFVQTYGGLPELFRGWGGEDGAWWHKAKLLGCADVVKKQDQYIYHLFHPNSGANGGSKHRDNNPYYSHNVAVLAKMRSITDRQLFLERFPPQPLFSSAWQEKSVLLFGEPPLGMEGCSADQLGRALADITGFQVEHRPACEAGEAENQADAIVALGTPAAMAFLAGPSRHELWSKTVVLHGGEDLNDATLQQLGGSGAVLSMQGPGLQRLQRAGPRPWPIPRLENCTDPSRTAALRILQPLSIILGGTMPRAVESATTTADLAARSNGGERRKAASGLNEVSILITSFLRPACLRECLAGIEKNLPECKVIVVDDSGDELPGGEIRVPLISLSFDSGLSAKRNAGVRACETKYLLMGSDDFDFSTAQARAGVEKLVRVLEEHPQVDVAGGHHNNHCYEGFLDLAPGKYIKETRIFAPNGRTGYPQSLSENYEVYKVDLIVNYFLARTESIRQYPWDERMKIGGEHGDWFLTLKQAGKTVVWVPGVNINELPYDRSKEHPDYGKYRGRAVSLGHKIFMEKRGITHYFGFDEPVPAALKASPKILLAVITCKENAERVRAQHDTWIPRALAAGYEVEIFDGDRLGVPDDYYSLIQKTITVCQWAMGQGYDRLLKVDDDCSIRIDQLLPATADYAGIVITANDFGSSVPPGAPPKPRGTYPYNYASGGAYWLSRKAMTVIASTQPNGDWAEDRFVGNTLARHGIFVQRLPGYLCYTSERMPFHWTVLTQIPTPALIREASR